MNTGWTTVLDFCILSVFLIVGTMIKRRIRFFQKYLIPNAIIAGFLGLICGQELLKLVDLNPDRMGTMVYHLMTVGFIALTLKERPRAKNRDVTNTGLFIVSNYLVQGILGFALSLGMMYTLFPDLFPAFGLLLPLGFGQGPGQAYAMGRQWEEIGFLHGGNMGLTIAAMGFIWACICGIPFINWLSRKKKREAAAEETAEERHEPVVEIDSPDDIPLSESIDRITVQIALIGLVYLVTYLAIKVFSDRISGLGTFGQTFAQLIWGFSFIIGSLFAILTKIILGKLKKAGQVTRNYTNNFLLQRIAGGAFDYMIAASICGISIFVVREYLAPMLIVTTAGGLFTVFFDYYMARRIYKRWFYENVAGMYGMMTGTISTGLALIREIDPEFKSNAARNLVMGSGTGLIAGFPLMLLLNVPIMGYTTGQPILYFAGLAGFVVYLAVLLGILFLNTRTRPVDGGSTGSPAGPTGPGASNGSGA